MKSDIDLLIAAQKLDEEAITAIFEQFAPAIYKYTLRLCHDPIGADHILGDVFAQLLEQFKAGKGPHTNLRSYLYQTAYHLVVDRSRDNQHNAPLEDAAGRYESGQFSPTQTQIEERDMMEALISTINTELTEDQRNVIILRFLEDFSLKETAEILGKKINNIKVIQNRALAKLRKAMGLRLDEDREVSIESHTDELPPPGDSSLDVSSSRLPGTQATAAPPSKKKKRKRPKGK